MAETTKVEATYPLSPLQHALLSDDARPDIAVGYWSCRLHGALDVPTFTQAWRRLVDCWPVLRTFFVWKRMDRPVQVVLSGRKAGLAWHDWRALPTAEHTARLAALAQQVREHGCDPDRPPLVHLTLAALSEHCHMLFCHYHRLVLDPPSLTYLLATLLADYEALRAGRDVTPQSSQSFFHCLAGLRPRDAEGDQQFWSQKLTGGYAPTILPLPRVQEQDTAGAPVTVELAMPVVWSQDGHPAVRLVAAWAVLLSRYSGEATVTFGVVVSPRAELAATAGTLVGPLCHTLPVRLTVPDNMPLPSWLSEVCAVLHQVHDHQHVSHAQLRAWGGLDAALPLCESRVVVEPLLPLPTTLAGGLHITADHGVELPISPLTLTARLEPNASLRATFDPSHFDAPAVHAMLSHLRVLLERMHARPEQPVSQLTLLTEAERLQVVDQWNATRTSFPPYQYAHQLFEAQVERTPDRAAVVYEDEVLTYRQLNARANQLAHYLRDMGVAADIPVGIFLDRSPALVVCVLAVLKAGGAFLPLDPDYPYERIAFILEDAAPPVLLTRADLEEQLPSLFARIICVDTEWETIAASCHENPPGLTPDLAYLIYTSGSTGTPKGTQLVHQGLCNLALAQIHLFRVTAESRVLQFAPFSFDAAVSEIFMALGAGAALCLAPATALLPGEALQHTLRHMAISHVTLPPSVLALDYSDPLPALNTVISAGEACSTALVARWSATRLFLNAYGPTESTVCATAAVCQADDPRPSIGRPIANMQVYLLDRHLQPVPPGVPGELHIGGIGLARGYLNRPALTAARFMPHPFPAAVESGARLYKTGDLARYLPDGRLEFLGRLDHQVKLRGFRIELGEIEATLLQHPEVREAVVVVREDESLKYLIAYVVPTHAEPALGQTSLYRLPNQLDIHHLNRNETEVMYNEIYTEHTYLQHGIRLPEEACIFDVGANIGLFTLYASQKCSRARIYAFEPVPPIFATLAANVTRFGLDVHLYECGLSNRDAEATGTYYPNLSGMSGFYADAEADQGIARAFLQNQDSALAPYAETFLEGRFHTETFPCRLRTLSAVIAEHHLTQIDLLKIDVEKSERDVLEGIAAVDWPKIKHIVMEVHDLAGRVQWLTNLLEHHGFAVTVSQHALLRHTELYTLYAVRPGAPVPHAAIDATSPCRTLTAPPPALDTVQLRDFLAEKLPSFMVPHLFVTLEVLPHTPNGKVDRHALPAPHRQGEPTQYVAPRTTTERLLTSIWADILKLEQVGIHDNFFALGGDSILSLQIVARAKQAGLQLVPKDMFTYQTIAGLAAVATPLTAVSAEQGSVVGPVPLTPIQHWFFAQALPEPHHYNQAVVLQVAPELPPDQVREALVHILRQHDALRLRFSQDGTEWRQEHGKVDAQVPLTVVDLSGYPANVQSTALAAHAATIQASLNFTHGPLLRAVLFQLGAALPGRLLLAVHHLAIDAVSWRIVLEDLETACRQLQAGTAVQLPAKTTSFKTWAEHLVAYGEDESVTAESAFWLDTLRQAPAPLPLEASAVERVQAQTHNTVAAAAHVAVALEAPQTHALLYEMPRVSHSHIDDVLLTALVLAFAAWTGERRLLVDVESHGRVDLFADVDLSRTVGWCTTLYPMLLDVREAPTPGAALRAVTEQRRRVPHHGIGFGLLQYCHSARPLAVETLPHAEVSFNYLGRFNQGLSASSLFTPAPEAPGPIRAATGQRTHLIEINAIMAEDQLHVDWTYSVSLHHRETVARLAQAYLDALTALVEYYHGLDTYDAAPRGYVSRRR